MEMFRDFECEVGDVETRVVAAREDGYWSYGVRLHAPRRATIMAVHVERLIRVVVEGDYEAVEISPTWSMVLARDGEIYVPEDGVSTVDSTRTVVDGVAYELIFLERRVK